MSLPEILVVVVVILVFVGPEKLPEVARVVGNGLREIRRATNLFRDTMMFEEETRQIQDSIQRPLDQPLDVSADDPGEPTDQPIDNYADAHESTEQRKARMWRTPLPALDSSDGLRVVELPPAEPATGTRTAFVPFPHRTAT